MKFRLILVLCIVIPALTAGAGDLHFIVHGVDSARGGTISAGVYASEEGYLEPGFEVASAVAVRDGEEAVGVFSNLPPGRYVVAVLHDENGDMMMETGAMGIPQEGYGFSGTTRPVTIPPKYRKAAVEVRADDSVTVDVYMKY